MPHWFASPSIGLHDHLGESSLGCWEGDAWAGLRPQREVLAIRENMENAFFGKDFHDSGFLGGGDARACHSNVHWLTLQWFQGWTTWLLRSQLPATH